MLDKLNQQLMEFVNQRNNAGISDFDGLSPAQMHVLMYSLFEDDSPITFNLFTGDEYTEMPIFNLVKALAQAIGEHGELKLTGTGNLPPKIVKVMYDKNLLKDEHVESGLIKLRTETDYQGVHLSRILLDLAGITKKQKNRLSLTKKGQKLVEDNAALFNVLITTFCNKFNWSYLDGYESEVVGRMGFEYSLYLLTKYGNKKREKAFYSEKYLLAFPASVEDFQRLTYSTPEKQVQSCYSIRTFDRCLKLFGLVDIEAQGKGLDCVEFITTTPLFEKLVDIKL